MNKFHVCEFEAMREEVIDMYILGSYAGILAASAYNTIAELLTHMP